MDKYEPFWEEFPSALLICYWDEKNKLFNATIIVPVRQKQLFCSQEIKTVTIEAWCQICINTTLKLKSVNCAGFICGSFKSQCGDKYFKPRESTAEPVFFFFFHCCPVITSWRCYCKHDCKYFKIWHMLSPGFSLLFALFWSPPTQVVWCRAGCVQWVYLSLFSEAAASCGWKLKNDESMRVFRL